MPSLGADTKSLGTPNRLDDNPHLLLAPQFGRTVCRIRDGRIHCKGRNQSESSGMYLCARTFGLILGDGHHQQLVAIAQNGADGPFEGIAALFAEIAREEILAASPLAELGRWVALGDGDSAPVPLEDGPGGLEGQRLMGLDRLAAAGAFPAAEEAARVQGGGKVRLGWDDDVDAFAEGIWIDVDVGVGIGGAGSNEGVVGGVAFGDGVEAVVFGPIVVLGVVS